MDPLAELLKTAQDDHKPMRHRMRAAHQALRAMPASAPEATWKPFRDLFDEVLQHKPPYAEVLRSDAANVCLWWDGRRRPASAVLPEIDSEPVDGAPAGMSDSLAKIRATMLDSAAPLSRRLDAAEIYLDLELSPGAAAGVPPEQIASEPFQFLRAVEASDAPDGHRFRALRAIARIENARATRSTPAQATAHREFIVRLVNSARSRELRLAGVWQEVLDNNASWTISSTDEFDEPQLPLLPAASAVKLEADARGVGGIMHSLRAVPDAVVRQHAEQTHKALLAVEARNRPDRWRRLLVEGKEGG